METLYEFSRLNSRNKHIIDSLISQKDNSPLKKLNSIVFSGAVLDDEEAMLEIYGRRNLTAFSRLKSRLKEVYINCTLLQGSTLNSEDSRINETIIDFKHALVVKFLRTQRSHSLATVLAEKAINRSIKYHSTENILLLCRTLIQHFGVSEFNKYKLNKYLTIQEKYLGIHSWEIKAENYYNDLQRIQFQSLATPSSQAKDKAREYMDELESVKNVRTFYFCLNRYRVKAAYFEYQKDYKSLLKLSEETLKEFSAPDIKTDTVISNINLRRAWALIQAGRYADTIVIGQKQMTKLSPGSPGWYFTAHYVLKAYLYQGDYKHAIELISKMIENPKFNKIGHSHQELFNTTLGYIHLIVDSGFAGDVIELQKKLPEFKIGKFLNTSPVFSKDKRGINVSILLMHVVVLLQRKDYNAIIDRVDSLNQYAYRYLRKDDTFRSNCMIKMVIQITKADFNPIRTERYTRELLRQLEQVKLAGSGENIETEIIPYEVLWKIMIKCLLV